MKSDDRAYITMTRKVTANGLIIWGLSALFYFYEFWLQVSPGVMGMDLKRAFSINALQLGNLTAFYFYAYAIMQIPAGMLIDRFGPRRLLLCAVTVCAGGSFLFGMASELWEAQLARTVIGIGSSFAVVSSLKLAINWLPAKYFALFTGFMITIGMSGAFVGEGPLAIIVDSLTWRPTMYLFALIGCALFVLMLLIIRDHPKQYTEDSKTVKRHRNLFVGLKQVVKGRQIWIVSIYGGLMYAPTIAFGAPWGVPFLMTSHNISATLAGFLVSLVFAGWAVGGPIFGWFSLRIQRRKPPMVIGGFGALICILLVIYATGLPVFMDGILLALFGFFSSGFLVVFALVKEITPHSYAGSAMGFINTLNTVGGALLQLIVGDALDLYWGGGMLHGMPLYHVVDYHIALAVLPGSLVLAILFLPFIKETYCNRLENENSH